MSMKEVVHRRSNMRMEIVVDYELIRVKFIIFGKI